MDANNPPPNVPLPNATGAPGPQPPPTPPPLPKSLPRSGNPAKAKTQGHKSPVSSNPSEPVPSRKRSGPGGSGTAAAKPIPVARPIPIAAGVDPVQMLDAAVRNSDRKSPEEDDWDNERLLNVAPPWAISLVTHALIILILGLVFLPGMRRQSLVLEATFSDSIGEQLDMEVELSSDDSTAIEPAVVLTTEDLPTVEDPLSTMPELDLVQDTLETATSMNMPSVSVALDGREVGMKSALLKAYGGSAETEQAVKNALKWLWRQQRRAAGKHKGSWSLVGPYKSGGEYENRIAATAMATLAFQGAGHTPNRGEYKKDMRSAWDFLLKQQNQNGSFYEPTRAPNDRFYTHSMATIALCELLAMTKDSSLIVPAQKAIDYLVESQGERGGWRYQPNGASDLSVTGWAVMALQSARMAGLNVPTDTLNKVMGFLDQVEVGYGDSYAYLPETVATRSMTAEGLLCRQYLGWKQHDPRLASGSAYLANNPIKWRDPSLYYWYYATQVLHHMEGKHWEKWNRSMRVVLPNEQESVGPERGSWYHTNDRWTEVGGRLYSTCMCTYMLEVYYRHLPIYNPVFSKSP